MKLCINCVHIQKPKASDSIEWIGEYSLCGHGMKINPVTGERDVPTQSSKFCSSLRESQKSQDCGPDGQFFSPQTLSVYSAAKVSENT